MGDLKLYVYNYDQQQIELQISKQFSDENRMGLLREICKDHPKGKLISTCSIELDKEAARLDIDTLKHSK